jgi:hypothetical protein
VVEDGHGGPAGVGSGDLHGVLDGLSAGVEQRRLLRVVAGRQLRELLADVDVPVVRRHHETGVGEGAHLLGDPVDHLGCGVADAGDRDPRRQVDQRVAVDVDDHAAAGRGDEDRQRGADAGRHVLPAAGQRRQRDRPGDVGDEVPPLREARPAGGPAVCCSAHVPRVDLCAALRNRSGSRARRGQRMRWSADRSCSESVTLRRWVGGCVHELAP